MFSVIPLVFTTNHGFNLQENGAVFGGKIHLTALYLLLTIIPAMCIGSIISTVVSIYQEKLAIRYGKMSSTPEGRLYFSCLQSGLLPVGLFWFAWTLAPSIPWILPCMAIGCATMGLFSIYLATFHYLADTYQRYASSALAAQSFCTLRSPGPYLPDGRLTCTRPKHARRSFPANSKCDVPPTNISRGVEFTRWNRELQCNYQAE